jgi:hypothetical protein
MHLRWTAHLLMRNHDGHSVLRTRRCAVQQAHNIPSACGSHSEIAGV